MTVVEVLFLIAAISAILALFLNLTDRKSAEVKPHPFVYDRKLPSFARGKDVEDAEIVYERKDIRR